MNQITGLDRPPYVFACCLFSKRWRCSIQEQVAPRKKNEKLPKAVSLDKQSPKRELLAGLETGFSDAFFLHFISDIQIPDEEVLFGPQQGLYPKHGRRVGIWMSWVVVCIFFSTVNSCNLFFFDFVFRN